MAYPAYRPFEAPHRAKLPERFVQTGVLLVCVAAVVPLAIADRLLAHNRTA